MKDSNNGTNLARDGMVPLSTSEKNPESRIRFKAIEKKAILQALEFYLKKHKKLEWTEKRTIQGIAFALMRDHQGRRRKYALPDAEQIHSYLLENPDIVAERYRGTI